MKPIAFTCDETLPLTPEDIARQILDLTKWPDFHGYGPIPGIKAAEFDVQTSKRSMLTILAVRTAAVPEPMPGSDSGWSAMILSLNLQATIRAH